MVGLAGGAGETDIPDEVRQTPRAEGMATRQHARATILSIIHMEADTTFLRPLIGKQCTKELLTLIPTDFCCFCINWYRNQCVL